MGGCGCVCVGVGVFPGGVVVSTLGRGGTTRSHDPGIGL